MIAPGNHSDADSLRGAPPLQAREGMHSVAFDFLIQRNTQTHDLAGGWEPPLRWLGGNLPAKQQFIQLLTIGKKGNCCECAATDICFFCTPPLSTPTFPGSKRPNEQYHKPKKNPRQSIDESPRPWYNVEMCLSVSLSYPTNCCLSERHCREGALLLTSAKPLWNQA